MKNIYFIEFSYDSDHLYDPNLKEIDSPIIEESINYIHYKKGRINKDFILDYNKIGQKTEAFLNKEWFYGDCTIYYSLGFIYEENNKTILAKKKLVKKLCTKEFLKQIKANIKELERVSNKIETRIQQ